MREKFTFSEKESFAYSSYQIMADKPSKIVEGHVHRVCIGFGCPRCKTINTPSLEHGEHRQCGHCKLNLQLFGNGLFIWT